MGLLKSLIALNLVCISACLAHLHELNSKYEWKQLDYSFNTPDDRRDALDTMRFIPKNNIPVGFDVYKDKLFITVPRSKMGVPSSLNYIKLTDGSSSQNLIPYPSWEAHTIEEDPTKAPSIVSAIRVRVDRCDRLWVLDAGTLVNLHNETMKYPPTIIVYDLKTDQQVQKYAIPATQFKNESEFTNLVVEDTDCLKTYAYAADTGEAGIVVYSLEKNESWRIAHHFFHLDPLACDYNVNGLKFEWANALYGLGLSPPNADNFSTLYFHPMSSNYEFSVSTKYLRSQAMADGNFFAFKNLGSKGPSHQSGVSFVDPTTGVLFYSLVNMNAVACWKTSENNITKKQDTIYMNNETMIYPSDIKVDSKKNLWILSNRLPILMQSELDPNVVNFRVFSVPVKNAIRHRACDTLVKSSATFASLSLVVFLTWLTTLYVSY